MVALDDVGSGYSTLNMVAQLLPDIVKIDREIMNHIDSNAANQSIFKTSLHCQRKQYRGFSRRG